MEDLPPDIRKRIARDFGEENADRIAEKLSSGVPESPVVGVRLRKLRCIVHLSHGDEARLGAMIELCLLDERDLFWQAEYEGETQVRDFTKPFED